MGKARAAITPHNAPIFPAMVKARINNVNGAHLKRKTAQNNDRSRLRIFDTRFFKTVLYYTTAKTGLF